MLLASLVAVAVALSSQLTGKETEIKKSQNSLKGAQTEVEDLKAQLNAERQKATKLGAKLEQSEKAAESAAKGAGGDRAKFEKDKEKIEEGWNKKVRSKDGAQRRPASLVANTVLALLIAARRRRREKQEHGREAEQRDQGP